MAGGLLGSNSVGVAPSTVMKKSGSLSGLLGSEACSEKYSVLAAVTLAVDSPAKRLPARAFAAFAARGASVTGSGGAVVLVWILASGRVGSMSPSGPVSTFNVWNTAFLTVAEGAVTMNSARPAVGMRM